MLLTPLNRMDFNFREIFVILIKAELLKQCFTKPLVLYIGLQSPLKAVKICILFSQNIV